ncbi:phage tail tape measure protein [Pararhodobacter sp. CCB-MM2]|uniref:phage tail tape measure protein n=1 Tax=Pararhodobacter sp. CCB-MM2 TaxID=1786003 RepID=UPI00351052EC
MDELNAQLAALETQIGATSDRVAGFDSSLADMGRSLGETNREMAGLSRGLGSGLRRAFDGVIFDGQRLSDAMQGLGRSISNAIYAAAMRPVHNAVGGALSSVLGGVMNSVLPFANGASFAQGRVMPFAQGGVVSSPVTFPMRGGTGLMGEAGPEAILPLARGADGKLGVRGAGGRSANVTINVTTPDVAGFQRSQSQIAAQMQRLLAQGQRNY